MNLSAIGKILKTFPILFVCGILILLSSTLLMIRGSKVEERKQELQELERKWSQMQVNLDRSRELEEEVARLDQQLERLRERLFEVDEVAENFEFFYQLEEENNVKLRQFTQGKPGDGEDLEIGRKGLSNFSVLPYAMVAEGNFAELLEFLTALNHADPIVRIDDVRLAKAGDSARSQELVVRFNCHVLATPNK